MIIYGKPNSKQSHYSSLDLRGNFNVSDLYLSHLNSYIKSEGLLHFQSCTFLVFCPDLYFQPCSVLEGHRAAHVTYIFIYIYIYIREIDVFNAM